MRQKKTKEPLYRIESKNNGNVSYLSIKGIDALTKSVHEAAKYNIDLETQYTFINNEYISFSQLDEIAKTKSNAKSKKIEDNKENFKAFGKEKLDSLNNE